MGVCTCGRVTNIQELLNSFWESLPIREKNVKDIYEVTIAKKSTVKPIPDKKWLLYQDALLVILDYKENCLTMFDEALKLARDKGNEGILFLSLLFLGKSTKTSDFKVNFLNLGKTSGGIKDDLRTDDEDKVNKISYKMLYLIISFYVNMITLLPAKFMTIYADGNKDFEPTVTETFSPEKQKKVIDENIMVKYEKEKNEWIDFDKFFDVYYPNLKNDSLIRSYFIKPEVKKK